MSNSSSVWFITGTSTGFGRSLALEAIERGQRVVATARDLRTLDALVALAPERVLALRLDVTQPQEIQAALDATLARFGQIDVVVNNAGYTLTAAVEETTDAALRSVFEPMFFGPLALTRAVLPHLRERRTGTIVQLTSALGLVGAAGHGAYSAVKHALEGMSEALATEVAPLGIKVLIVEPGMFRTNLLGGGYQTMPALPAYDAVMAPLREWMKGQVGAQAGDPGKAAKAIVDVVLAGTPTLRLPLGGDAVDLIRAKLERVAADVTHHETVARATAFE